MKKRLSAFAFALMVLFSAVALGEISLTKRDIALNTGLDKNVSNILVLLQDGEKTDTMMLASINSRTGRSVMTRLDCALQVNVPEVGDVELGEVYMLGDQKSRGAARAAHGQHAAEPEREHVRRAGYGAAAGARGGDWHAEHAARRGRGRGHGHVERHQ